MQRGFRGVGAQLAAQFSKRQLIFSCLNHLPKGSGFRILAHSASQSSASDFNDEAGGSIGVGDQFHRLAVARGQEKIGNRHGCLIIEPYRDKAAVYDSSILPARPTSRPNRPEGAHSYEATCPRSKCVSLRSPMDESNTRHKT